MVGFMIRKLLMKYGMKKLLIMIGDAAVKATTTKKDDKIWKEVKKLLEKF